MEADAGAGERTARLRCRDGAQGPSLAEDRAGRRSGPRSVLEQDLSVDDRRDVAGRIHDVPAGTGRKVADVAWCVGRAEPPGVDEVEVGGAAGRQPSAVG